MLGEVTAGAAVVGLFVGAGCAGVAGRDVAGAGTVFAGSAPAGGPAALVLVPGGLVAASAGLAATLDGPVTVPTLVVGEVVPTETGGAASGGAAAVAAGPQPLRDSASAATAATTAPARAAPVVVLVATADLCSVSTARPGVHFRRSKRAEG